VSTLFRKMSDAHESFLAEVFGCRVSPGSGNQWHKPADGRQNRYERSIAWCFDGKSTRGKSIGVSRAMLDKITVQAHAERPMIALRFYDDDHLRGFEDWVCVRLDDFLELEGQG